MASKLIKYAHAETAEALIEALSDLAAQPEDGKVDFARICVVDAKTGSPVRLMLRENTLTDKSKTYDILVG